MNGSGHSAHAARRCLVLRVLAELRARGIPAAVLNGVSGPGKAVGRDVDLLVRPADVNVIVDLLRTLAAAQGWAYEHGRWLGAWYPRGLYQQVFHRIEEDEVQNVAFDLICSDGIAAGCIAAYSPQLLEGDIEWRDGIPVSSVATHMKSAFVKLLAGVQLASPTVNGSGGLPQEVRQHITRLGGQSFLRAYEAAIRERRAGSAWSRLRRRAQLAYVRRHPVAAARNAAKAIARQLAGSRAQHVVSVAVVGPDGVGKSSAIAHARRTLAGSFLDVRYRHWRPQVLPNLRALMSASARAGHGGEAVPPRRHAGRGAPVRLAYYGLDYALGYWVRDRCSTSSEIPVNLYDRCALDMLVDPLRFGLPMSSRVGGLVRYLPRPDRIIVLQDSPERIVARKPELAIEEIARQSQCWRDLHRHGDVSDIIDVGGRGAEAVGREIARTVLEAIGNQLSIDGRLPVASRQ